MKKGKKLKFLKVPVIILISALVIYFLINAIATSRIKDLLENQGSDSGSGTAKVSFENFRVNVFTGSASAKSVSVGNEITSSDSSLQLSFKSTSVRLSGFNWVRFLTSETASVGTLLIEEPEINVHNWSNEIDTLAEVSFSLYEIFHEYFHSLRISTIKLHEGTLVISSFDTTDYSLTIPSFNAEIEDLLVDSTMQGPGKLFSIKNSFLEIDHLESTVSKGLQRLYIAGITMNTKEEKISIDSVSFIPLVDERQFARSLGHQTDCMTLTVLDLDIQSSRLQSALEQQDFFIDRLSIGYLNFKGYRDRNIPMKHTRRKLHHSFLSSLDYAIDIREASVKDADVKYVELAEGADEPGSLRFSNTTVKLEKLSNVHMDDTLEVFISALMQDQALTEIAMKFPLSEDRFYFTGSTDSYDMRIWNSMIRNVAPFNIESGKASQTTFTVAAGENSGQGTMKFLYSDLKLKVDDDKNQRRFTDHFARFVADKILVADSNPHKNTLRIGEVTYQRDREKSLINYCWNLIYSGLKSSVGLKEEKLKRQIGK